MSLRVDPPNRAGANRAQAALAIVSIAIGVLLAAWGNGWAPTVLDLVAGSTLGAWLELIVPFLPMVFIGAGAWLLTRPLTPLRPSPRRPENE